MAHLLSSFMEGPPGIGFETQHENETIILLLRAHPITNVPWIVIAILLIIFPLLAVSLLPLLGLPNTSEQFSRILTVIFIVFELVALGYTFEQFLRYYFSVYIVTTERIVDIDFERLLSKKVADAQLADIEDVTYTQSGIFASIFNYGNLTVQTAGAKQQFMFYAVPRPDDVAQMIQELKPKGGNP